MRRALAKYRRFWIASACALIGSAIVSGAHGQGGVMEHEYIPPDPQEDLTLGALTPSGKMPAAIRTNSGLVSAPDPYRSVQNTSEPTYGAAPSKASRFKIDGVTSDPGTLHYHEPFRPSIAPFKRLRAFDAVNDAFELVVRDTTTHNVSLDNSPQAGEDEFFGDLTVTGGRAVAMPSVASGMRVLAAELEPAVAFQMAVDSAENWYFEAPKLTGKGRLLMRLVATRAAMSPEFEVASYTSLTSALNPLPPSVARAAVPVLEHIGISRVNSPTEAVRALVGYFRSFAPSGDHFTELSGRELYQRLALSQKGVCRHRAYAFMVTALALGIPARMVHNEAHAWVEVFDGHVWHRVDLGGAAPSFHFDGEVPEGAPYRMPRDNYGWPPNANPATQARIDASDQPGMSQVSADVSPGAQSGTPAPSSNAAPNVPPTTKDPSGSVDLNVPSTTPLQTPQIESAPASSSAASEPTPAPGTDANVDVILKSSPTPHRGEPLVVEGRIEPKAHCSQTRVDLTLQNLGVERALGSTLTDKHGHFHFQTFVPVDVQTGRYDVTARVRELQSCKD